MGITPTKFRGTTLPSSSGLNASGLKSEKIDADEGHSSSGQFSRHREDSKSQDNSANKTGPAKSIKDIFNGITQAATEIRDFTTQKFIHVKEKSKSAFKESPFSQKAALTNPTYNEV